MELKSLEKDGEVNVENLGKFIRKLRMERGMKQSDLAKILNIDSSTISKWENGNFAPDLFRIREVAAALGVSSDELLSLKVKDKRDSVLNKKRKIKRIAYQILTIVLIVTIFLFITIFNSKDDNEIKYYEIIDNCDELDFDGTIMESKDKIVVSINNMFYVNNKKRSNENNVENVVFIYYIGDEKVYELSLNGDNKKLSDILNFYNFSFEISNNNFDISKSKIVISYRTEKDIIDEIYIKYDFIELS